MKVLKLSGLLALGSAVVTGIFFQGCSGISSRQELVDSLFLYLDDAEIYYELKEPDRKYDLPYVLAEVSGITFKKPDHLLAIDDEAGVVFDISLKSGDITGSTKFARPGDFEDLELVNDTVYALRSDGHLFKFRYDGSDETESKLISTPLTVKNNTEGLGYDPRTGNLLITTKETGDYKDHKVQGNAVYSVQAGTGIMDEPELFSISNDDLNDFFERVKKQKYEKDRFKFEPSAIAFNPVDKNYYVLASVGKLLLVVNRQGKIISSYPILPRILNQPEGICFAPNGDMYISSEGEGDRGFVLHFRMLRK